MDVTLVGTKYLDFENVFDCYKYIGEHLKAGIPKPWASAALTVLLSDDSSARVSSYRPVSNPDTEVSFFFRSPPEFELAFVDLAELTSDKERGLYNRCTFVLQPDGQYEVDFEYDIADINEQMLALGRPD